MKKVIVVSGASSGMGKEFLKQILEKESNVDEIWAIARRIDRLNELKKEVSNKIVPIGLDLTNEKDLLKYQDKLKKEKPLCLSVIVFHILYNFAPFFRLHIIYIGRKI